MPKKKRAYNKKPVAAAPVAPVSTRKKCLDLAAEAVLKDRNAAYGGPEDNFRDIADMFSIYLRGRSDLKLLPHDIAIVHTLTKVCRIKTSPTKLDNWTDIAGYGACGAESAKAS